MIFLCLNNVTELHSTLIFDVYGIKLLLLRFMYVHIFKIIKYLFVLKRYIYIEKNIKKMYITILSVLKTRVLNFKNNICYTITKEKIFSYYT